VFGVANKGSDEARFLQLRDGEKSPLTVLACDRTLPYEADVKLVWGQGIESLSGIPTSANQELAFKTRKPFEASFSCERVNKQAQCIPVLPMSLGFTAPIPAASAERIRLVAATGKVWKPKQGADEKGSGFTDSLSFAGPFPEKTRFRIELPRDLKDDAGRLLRNAANFPLTVRTDESPPLAKFSARFGILESRAYPDGTAALPVTLRNVESRLSATSLALAEAPAIAGQAVSVPPGNELAVVAWLRRLERADEDVRRYNRDTQRQEIVAHAGASSIFTEQDRRKHFTLPKPLGQKAFEVIGIPLKTGFHVVEIASPRLGAALLGAALLGEAKPYHVHAAALVTNLAVHFKKGRESSLVWVTRLDTGEPVAGTAVAVWDCGRGERLWSGKTDRLGVSRIDKGLPLLSSSGCLKPYDNQYFVTARLGDDYSFDLSGWNGGIASWRFNLPGGVRGGRDIVHAVLDRTLLRTGETAHMKLVARRPTRQGFALAEPGDLGTKLVIRHEGSNQTWDVPLDWDATGTATADFTVPREAKQGLYSLEIEVRRDGQTTTETVGSFRVEAFRIPTLRAKLQGPATPAVNATEVPIDLQIGYLSGGGAAGLPVKLRAQLQPRGVSFPGYEEFTLANGGVKEGLATGEDRWSIGEYSVEDGDESESEAEPERAPQAGGVFQVRDLVLDGSGGGRARFDKLPRIDKPMDLLAEAEYRDANGETLAAATHVPLWPSAVVLGVKTDSWLASKDSVHFQIVALDTQGRPIGGVAVKADLLQSQYFSHRRRLIGGFYAYEHGNEVKRLGDACGGVTDARGLLLCEIKPPASGSLILHAAAADAQGNASHAHSEIWVPGDETWFAVQDNDRIDLLPEKRRYEPGETARFQVRMPFRRATALVTVEREGIVEAFVRSVSRDDPVIEIPLKGDYAPNVYVSVFLVRGRVGTPAPTALVDLGKPAYKMGMAAIEVGWGAHELKVKVAADQPVYRVREKAAVIVQVQRGDGKPLPKGTEVALAAVDEGLLELMPNDSWQLLDAMMRRRGLEVETSTAQMQVVGKRHFGRKSQPPGGGGGRQPGRELFDTLLLWQARVVLDDNGEARVTVPLNDSLSSFRIVAVAQGGLGWFGSGHTAIRTTQDLMLISGLPPVVREQDKYRALFVVRNASERALDAQLTARMGPPGKLEALPPQALALAPGEALEVAWEVKAPVGADTLHWEVNLKGGEAVDRLKLTQKVIPAVPVRTIQATIAQLAGPLSLPIALPNDAVPGRGGIQVGLQAKLADNLDGVREFMGLYRYTCFEQRASVAVALHDPGRWKSVMADLPSHLDGDGLAKYFPSLDEGSDVLTAYLLAIADEARLEIPALARERMEKALVGFVEGRVIRHSALPTADLAIRKVAALEALSRGKTAVESRWLDSISVQPNLWPTSAVLDWYSLMKKSPKLPRRDQRLAEAERILRARLNFQGTTMGFSTERSDALWWLMVSGDANANRMLALFLDNPAWKADIPRLVRGALGRQQRGHWHTTVANAWGVVAMDAFSTAFESEAVTGKTVADLGKAKKIQDWSQRPQGVEMLLPWPARRDALGVRHDGEGKPWVMVRGLAAIPLAKPFSSGYRITRSVAPVEQKVNGEWHRGDVLRVRLELEAQSDMSWVVVDDPVPAGAAILGTGLGRDAKLRTRGEKRQGWVWPAFEERTFTAFRAYYPFVPKGSWTVEYTLRLNNPGEFRLPETHVEAMYAPEMFGELPNARLVVKP